MIPEFFCESLTPLELPNLSTSFCVSFLSAGTNESPSEIKPAMIKIIRVGS